MFEIWIALFVALSWPGQYKSKRMGYMLCQAQCVCTQLSSLPCNRMQSHETLKQCSSNRTVSYAECFHRSKFIPCVLMLD